MARTKAKEIRGLTSEELGKQLEETRRELFNLRFRLATKQLENHRALRATRRHIAQLASVMRERELATGG
ncbi:MAG: 50S ribosomal protein L29 [Dehalococcoidia bacterium]|nr:50S ribosomal protein L29 [Dehalococcoidia bacterium]